MEEALVKRIMPNSLEAEQSVIGSMIMDQPERFSSKRISITSSMEFCLNPCWICLMRENRLT